ncbi:hypothetical protein PISL3812_07203 [Talaromyces islandicus]|uniref:GPI anchored protein n=1 Tax=Talaromyces islandicus TaxID=28573 RepID=A0A0U1M562_TALIS|nr:hypothetical protein PISL3812_07203 [Talaromyces islandicus]
MKTIYTAIPLAVLAAVGQAQEHGHGHGHDAEMHGVFGGDIEHPDIFGDTYGHDFLGDGFNKPHKKPDGHGPEGGPIEETRNGPRNLKQKGPYTDSGDNEVDGVNNDNIVITPVAEVQDQDASSEQDSKQDNTYITPPPPFPHGGPPGTVKHPRNVAPDIDFPHVFGADEDTDINSPNFDSAPVSGPYNHTQQKGPYTESGDNEVDGGVNNDNIVITPVAEVQDQDASSEQDSEQDNTYIAPPPPFPHGGPPPQGPPHGGPGGGEHGPEQLPPAQHSEPQHHAPPPGDYAHPEGGPGPAPGNENHAPSPHQEEKQAPAPAPASPKTPQQPSHPEDPPRYEAPHHEEPSHPKEPARDAVPAEHTVQEYPTQPKEEQPHPDRKGEEESTCTSKNHETPYPQARPEPVGGFPAQSTYEAKAAPQPEFNQGHPKPLGEATEGESYHARVHTSHAAHSSPAHSATVHSTKPSSHSLPYVSYRVEAHSSFVVTTPSHTHRTTPTPHVAATPAPHSSSPGTSAFVGGAGSLSVPQGFGMAVVGALAFLM